jgi:hypothetical protein
MHLLRNYCFYEFCQISAHLALFLTSFAACAEVLDPLSTEAVSARPATRPATRRATPSAQAQQASAQAGLASLRWQYWPTPLVWVETAGTSAIDSAYQGERRVANLRQQQPAEAAAGLTFGGDGRRQARRGRTQTRHDRIDRRSQRRPRRHPQRHPLDPELSRQAGVQGFGGAMNER